MTAETSSSCYFVMAAKHGKALENVRMGGFKTPAKAYAAFRKYSTGEIKVYTGKGLKTIAIRINNREYM